MLRPALLVLPLLLPLLASAQEASTDWTTVNLAVTDTHVLPRYTAFATAAGGLQGSAAQFCMAPSGPGLEILKSGFHSTMDAWQEVQHIQFGPVTYFNWNFRVQYWPDDNGTGGRQLAALLAGQDSALLTPETFARQSVGVQGFQALEVLLFEDDSLAALQQDPYRCAVLQAIAINLNEIASGVTTRWRDEFRASVADADNSDYFESAEDATVDFMKALVEPVRRIKEQKLDAVLGETPDTARPRRAENWRAARELRNIRLNVLSLQNLFEASEPQLASVLLPADVATIDTAFATLLATLEQQPESLAVALESANGHGALLEVAKQLDALFEALEAGLKNTSLYLGFNSLDGD